MNKTQKMKKATRKTRWNNIKAWIKKVCLFPVRVIKAVWRFICRICRAIWNWLKSIDIIGMINLTLLVIIIVFFTYLIRDFSCRQNVVVAPSDKAVVTNTVSKKSTVNDNRKVVNRPFKGTLPVKADAKTGIKPQITVVGVHKPQVVQVVSVPSKDLPKQKLNGDVIVDTYPNSPVLSNGVKINGNLFIQNMRKYTLPCDAKINGNLFIRNVEKLNFCGAFTVRGNIYVSRQSSFGAIPRNARVSGQIIL